MELTTEHRRALLTNLEQSEKDARQAKDLMDQPGIRGLVEVEHFLAIQRIDLIKTALIENQIDY